MKFVALSVSVILTFIITFTLIGSGNPIVEQWKAEIVWIFLGLIPSFVFLLAIFGLAYVFGTLEWHIKKNRVKQK